METTLKGVMEIQLEQLDGTGWRGAAANSAFGIFGRGKFRFAARAPLPGSAPQEWCSEEFDLALSAAADLTDDSFEDEARARLDELEASLATAGWERLPGRGRHWWSRRYQHR